MKKIIFTSVAFLACGTFTLNSCTKSVNCATLVVNVSTAANNYTNSQTTANCQAYKSALNAWLNDTDCSGLDATTKATFQADLDSLTACP